MCRNNLIVRCGITAIVILTLILVANCEKAEDTGVSRQKPPVQKVSEPSPAEELAVLFDGSNLEHWQMVNTGGWTIEDGAMSRAEGGGDIWTKERFDNFVLECEFKVSPGCNSGIFFRTADLADVVQTGIEMQVFDSADSTSPGKHDCGAVYDLLEPSMNTMKAAGEWNQVSIYCNDNLIKIVLNNVQIIDMDLDEWTAPNKNPDGTANKFNTALKDFAREGHIGFQDHGYPVWYRNVRTKEL